MAYSLDQIISWPPAPTPASPEDQKVDFLYQLAACLSRLETGLTFRYADEGTLADYIHTAMHEVLQRAAALDQESLNAFYTGLFSE